MDERQTEEIAELKKENDRLWGEIRNLHETNRELVELLSQALDDIQMVNQNMKELEKGRSINENRIRNLPYEMFDPRVRDTKYRIPRILSIPETVDQIVSGKSIARFGDGEIGIMCNEARWRFQRTDEKLAKRLTQVILSEEPEILIGLNDLYGDLDFSNEPYLDALRAYITPETRAKHMQFLSLDRVYANALISRNANWEIVKEQKRIWDGRDTVFVEGDQTRMGIGNDLFDNISSIRRILCPAENAFDRYEEILAECLKQSRDTLFLIALGPTASVLSYDLAKEGYHAVDIGHADITYEWLLRSGGKGREAIPGKYTNESIDGYLVEELHDPEYENQIVADLSGRKG